MGAVALGVQALQQICQFGQLLMNLLVAGIKGLVQCAVGDSWFLLGLVRPFWRPIGPDL